MSPEQNQQLMIQEHARGRLAVANLPTMFTLESTSICNLRCVMCPHSIGDVARPRHMPEEILAALSGALPVARQVQLHGIGEPLASPAFWRALDVKTFDEDADVNINTNLTLLNDRRIERLLAAGPKLTLNVSLDAATADTYRKIRGAEFSEVVANLARLREGRGQRTHPRILVNMTLMRTNIEEVVALVDLACDLRLDGVFLGHLNRYSRRAMARYRQSRGGWDFDYAREGLWNHTALSNLWIGRALDRGRSRGIEVFVDQNKAVWFDPAASNAETPVDDASRAAQPQERESQETVKDCRYPWQWAMVTTDGAVRPCCYGSTVGHLSESGFDAIWNGPAMQSLRRDVKADRINTVCAAASCKFVQNSLSKAAPPERARVMAIRGSRQLSRGVVKLVRAATTSRR